MTVFESRVITKKLAEFEGNANKMLHFYLNYMNPFEIILLFVRSKGTSRSSTAHGNIEYLTRYFFTHDNKNHARLLSLYITTMQVTEIQHPDL